MFISIVLLNYLEFNTNRCNRANSGAEKKEVSLENRARGKKWLFDTLQENDTSTAILKKKKKPNSLMYVQCYIMLQ